MLRLTQNEYKRIKHNVHSPSRRAVRQDDATDEAHQQAIQTLRDIQGADIGLLFGSCVGIRCVINGKTPADIDNVFKGVADALQSHAYKNDRQVCEGYIRRDGV